jgi:hypothetical protein
VLEVQASFYPRGFFYLNFYTLIIAAVAQPLSYLPCILH